MRFNVRETMKSVARGASRFQKFLRNPRKVSFILAPLFLGALSSPALATTENNKAIAHVGAQSGTGYVRFVVPPTDNCSFDVIYFDITTDSGKSYYALLLTAYSAGRAVSRVDYTNTSGTCSATLVEM